MRLASVKCLGGIDRIKDGPLSAGIWNMDDDLGYFSLLGYTLPQGSCFGSAGLSGIQPDWAHHLDQSFNLSKHTWLSGKWAWPEEHKSHTGQCVTILTPRLLYMLILKASSPQTLSFPPQLWWQLEDSLRRMKRATSQAWMPSSAPLSSSPPGVLSRCWPGSLWSLYAPPISAVVWPR